MNVRPSLVGLVLTISVLPLSSVQGQNLKTNVENTQNTMDFCVGRITDLVADYEVKLTRPEGEKMRETRRNPLQLIKDQHNVAYHYPNLQITDLWQRNGNGQLSLVKGFDAQQRSIEYQPGEVKKTGSARWQKLASLIDPQLLQGLTLLSSTQLKCGVLEHYSGVMNGQVMSVNWLPHLQIPVSMTWQQPRETLNYQLTKVGEGASAFVATVQNYNATDFADIGDNESDPFLVKMINLGYVEHAHSGAYDSAGRALGPHNH